jgi:hypothetical protein
MYSAIRTICLSLGLFVIAEFACLEADFPQQESGRENVLARFKVSREYDSLLLPVKVEGKDYLFLLDTGASMSIYDKSFRSILGDPLPLDNLSVRIHTHAGGKEGLSLFRPPTAKLGNIDLPSDRPVSCIDFAKWRKLTKEEIYGAIGMDYLRDHVVRIDYDRGEVTFLRSVGTDPGTRVPLSLIYNVPHVWVTVPALQIPERFMVDTGWLGNNSGCLREAAFDMLAQRGSLTVIGSFKFELFLGSGKEKIGLLDKISLEDYCHKDLLFSRSKLSSFSLNYLSRYVVTFDFPNKAMYLKKGPQFDKVDLQDRSGLHILWEKGQVQVESVDDASPAARVGIKPHDVLLTIDDATASEMSLTRIRRLFCQRGEKHRLLIQRREEKKELILDLSEKGKRGKGGHSRCRWEQGWLSRIRSRVKKIGTAYLCDL